MFTIHPITKDQIAAITTSLAAHSTTIASTGPDTYHVTGHGVDATAVFDETAEELTVTVNHKPFYIPESAIQNGIQEALAPNGQEK